MTQTDKFYSAVFDAVPQHIAILDEQGVIQQVNASWKKYAETNGGHSDAVGIGVNYIEVCDGSARAGHTDANWVANSLRALVDDSAVSFSLDYPCHGPDEKRWFQVRGWPVRYGDRRFSIICHQDVTSTAVLHQELQHQASTDSLTGLSNKRHFKHFLNQEWRRDMRKETPTSLILLDLDYFKMFNDRYGHLAGDECLETVATLIQSYAQRPGDLAVRYGGEEFILLLGSTSLESATRIAHDLCSAIEKLNIAHEDSHVSGRLTASLGVAGLIPKQGMSEDLLVRMADKALYRAKAMGRNTVVQGYLDFVD